MLWARAHPVQDSSMLKVLAESDALIVRAPNASPLDAGADIEILKL
jgi:molybdopterin molybdotransferase